jgi:SAM-dependent methyltransferase
MTRTEYISLADAIARQTGVEATGHRHFLLHCDRIYGCCQHFGLLAGPLGSVLEIGPFFAYTPFALRGRAAEYAVVDGDDPSIYPLLPLYRERGVACSLLDLSDAFGEAGDAPWRLGFDAGSFDTIVCWETIEHFNFNPVPFVRELFRLLKPGGRALLTVPNHAQAKHRLKLLAGRSIQTSVDEYTEFAEYRSGAKRKYFGFHWREYTLAEFAHLFARQGFEIASAKHLLIFQNRALTPAGRLLRVATRAAFAVLPSLGNLCALDARKPGGG